MSRNLLPAWLDILSVPETDEKMKTRHSNAYNNWHGAELLSGLEAGQPVRVKNDSNKHWESAGVLSGYGPTPRFQTESWCEEIDDIYKLFRTRFQKRIQFWKLYSRNLIERRIDPEIPKETVDDMTNRTSRGRVVRRPKRYLEEC